MIKIEKNEIRCESHDHNDFSNKKKFKCENHDDNVFSIDIQTHKFRKFCYKTDEKILIILNNLDVKKKTVKT